MAGTRKNAESRNQENQYICKLPSRNPACIDSTSMDGIWHLPRTRQRGLAPKRLWKEDSQKIRLESFCQKAFRVPHSFSEARVGEKRKSEYGCRLCLSSVCKCRGLICYSSDLEMVATLPSLSTDLLLGNTQGVWALTAGRWAMI